jgi:hypothetical protein
MRVFWMTWGVLGMVISARSAFSQPPTPAGQLVREVVYNELNDHQRHGYWRYWIERRTQAGTRLEEQVETAEGPITRLVLRNGHVLTAEEDQQEEERLERLLASREEQARHLKQYDEDEERIGRILAMLPTAFVYSYDGEENGFYRMRFRANPEDRSSSIESRIFHAMSGEVWVDARAKRLARLEGHVDQDVDFGFGILGRLYKGGWFRLARVQVSATDWKTESLEVHLNIRALLVKTFARDTSEMRGGFVQVPAGMSFEQGLALLNQSESERQAAEVSQQNAAEGSGFVSQTALAIGR